VDVGYGQLDWRLRQDARVVVMERVNFRYMTKEKIGQPLDLIVMDLSFISLKLVLSPAAALLKSGGRLVCLIKPQFEAGRDKVGKKGVVRDPKTHLEVLQAWQKEAVRCGYTVKGLTFSPIQGPEGNIEYLGYLEYPCGKEQGVLSEEMRTADIDALAIVTAAHAAFSKVEER
jgi:23S rRNA (cytidine1920-2'-O)/16S rRNA (cytidine1409-2'-O)-methyltransferase